LLVISFHLSSTLFLFFLSSVVDHRHLHSFPTRRSSDLVIRFHRFVIEVTARLAVKLIRSALDDQVQPNAARGLLDVLAGRRDLEDRKITRLNSSHEWISYAVFCLKKKKK